MSAPERIYTNKNGTAIITPPAIPLHETDIEWVRADPCTPTDERVRALEDGRPCSTDIWMAAAIQQLDDDKWDFFDACKCWVEGDWDGAMEGVTLPSQPRAALSPISNDD